MISFLWYENSQKVTKKSQNLLKVLPKTVLFRNIALIFSLEKTMLFRKPCCWEPCKRRSACTYQYWPITFIFLIGQAIVFRLFFFLVPSNLVNNVNRINICLFWLFLAKKYGYLPEWLDLSWQEHRWLCQTGQNNLWVYQVLFAKTGPPQIIFRGLNRKNWGWTDPTPWTRFDFRYPRC